MSTFGSKRIVVGAHYGLRDWLAQRVTAVLMAVFTVVLLAQLLMPGALGYDRWAGIFSQQWMKLLTLVTIVSLAYFNMDIYQPTVKCLRALKKVVTKGSIIGFDELNCPHFPGETTALKDAFGLDNVRLIRHPHNPYPAYIVVE